MAQRGTSLCLHTWAAPILSSGPHRNAEGTRDPGQEKPFANLEVVAGSQQSVHQGTLPPRV